MNKYLPIGTVVTLKEGEKKVMITSYLIFSTGGNNTEKVMFDYGGCPFPEGIIESDVAVGFNHDQIDKVVHMGLIDEEQIKFNALLNDTTDEIKQKFAEGMANE